MKIQFILVAVLALSVSFLSCKKNNDVTASDNTDMVTHSDDQSNFSQSTDDITNDVNTTIDNYNAFDGFAGTGSVDNGITGLPCNTTAVLDSAGGLRRITLTFNGPNCNNTRNRVGVILLTMPLAQHWKDAGAALTINVQSLKITRLSDGKSITVNGTIVATNVTGGRLRDLSSLGTIVHTITSTGMTVTFDNGSQRSWQIAKQRTFTYNNGIVITTIGTHVDGSTTGISEWGTNRFGNTFVTAITQPMVIRQDCSWRLVSGQVTHSRLAATVVATFGLDSAGNPVSCPAGTFYYKIVWTGANGIVRTYILPY
ncbi:MAG: hypothetical protein IPP96_12295 [Chitinophagaceae bacterium]|nr:hypothetical protein [Chitinophagaceae bacterium]